MSIREVINYRKKCIIHGLPLVPLLTSAHCRPQFNINSFDLVVPNRFGYRNRKFVKGDVCAVRLSQNGTYIQTQDCPAYVSTFLREPVRIYMICSKCAEVAIPESPLKPISIDDLLEVQSYFTFAFWLGKNSTYQVELESEVVKYNVNDKFYHMRANFLTGRTVCEMGSCALFSKFDDILRSKVKIDIPQIKSDKIDNLSEYLDKMKLYLLFS